MVEEAQQRRDRTGPPEDLVLNLDAVLTTQPELGPSIPDGGYGWVVFVATLFFQALVPSLVVSFGIFLVFARLENATADDRFPKIWDENLLHVPLFFMVSRTIFDTFARALIAKSTWPRLVGTSGTCLTCAGLLFMWMGMIGSEGTGLYVLAGLFSGLGASLQLAQCEVLLAQYFRLKLPLLNQISKVVAALGFVMTPVLLGHNIINTSLLHVMLWYQAIILQGLVINIAFRKPEYLKSRPAKSYEFVTSNPDDEEDVFSKNTRELQLKRQTSTGSHETGEPQPSTSTADKTESKWEKFNDDDEEEVRYDKYNKLNEWETFDDEDIVKGPNRGRPEPDVGSSTDVNALSLAEETRPQRNGDVPRPLFSDMPVNNNSTYAYDDEIRAESRNSNVFMPNAIQRRGWAKTLDLLARPTFYKSLLMVFTNNVSVFVFYALFPSYLYSEVDKINLRQLTTLIGALSLVSLVFLAVSYWVRIDKKRRPICLWIMCWVGAVGYFMLADSSSEYALLAGAIQVVLSIAFLEHMEKSLLGITIKGENSREYGLLNVLSGLALLIFLFINVSLKNVFNLLALLQFFTGILWLANFIYKRITLF